MKRLFNNQYLRLTETSPDILSKTKPFGNFRKHFLYTLTTMGSPLVIILQKACRDLEDSGERSRLFQKQFGNSLIMHSHRATKNSLPYLTGERVSLIFVIMVATIVLVLCILGVEMACRNRVNFVSMKRIYIENIAISFSFC